MGVFDTSRRNSSADTPRLMTMNHGDAALFGARLVLTYRDAAETYARLGDAQCAVDELIPRMRTAITFGTVTTTSIRTTGTAA